MLLQSKQCVDTRVSKMSRSSPMSRSYLEMIKYPTYEERLQYLMLAGSVGYETFGYDRWVNQALYSSSEWREFRHRVIIRDGGCDLGVEGYEIQTRPLIHHINPITKDMVINRDPMIFDMNNVVTTTHQTHNAIHYGHDTNIRSGPVTRRPNDTCPWKH